VRRKLKRKKNKRKLIPSRFLLDFFSQKNKRDLKTSGILLGYFRLDLLFKKLCRCFYDSSGKIREKKKKKLEALKTFWDSTRIIILS